MQAERRVDSENLNPQEVFAEFSEFKQVESAALIQKCPENTYKGFKKFSYASHVPVTNNFYARKFNFTAKNEVEFAKAHARDLIILNNNVPDGMLVKGYECQKELFSALIFGPNDSPYDGGVFAFDIKLTEEYPFRPPEIRSFSFQRIHGQSNGSRGAPVRDFLFRTWRANHHWTTESSILDVLVNIQNVIAKPYGASTSSLHKALVNPNIELTSSMSKKFNESALLLFLLTLVELLQEWPSPWKIELTHLIRADIPRLVKRFESWLYIGDHNGSSLTNQPPVPLLPFEQPWEVEKLLKRLRSIRKPFNGSFKQ